MEIHCHMNPKLRCYIQDECPLRDQEFDQAIQLWLYTGRTVHSANLEPVGSNGGRVQAIQDRALRKAEIARLFEQPERVAWFYNAGYMARNVCEDIRRAHYLWEMTREPFNVSLRRAKRKWEGRHERIDM